MTWRHFTPPTGPFAPLAALALICRDATGLMIKKQLRPLSRLERFALRLHTLKCGPCRRCQHQFHVIDAAAAHIHEDPASPSLLLSSQTRGRIAAQLPDNADQ